MRAEYTEVSMRGECTKNVQKDVRFSTLGL